ncbi:hypothetical protein KHS38_15535 [Mucilaginibacter sp. Bleaf8]|uniref:hypothetical protein n=1 Tax=Mucilaginibacter sp. Bleaf8 TaxID=2834430 RepID=UPI001BCD32EE|nr:hypothetical protein [Mucilaginibacter sp. Bleaf8]MBS7565819.1 hypothetical protein [Mucilaginibacter sp. Bleaf8]
MKSIKYIAAIALLSASLTACTNNSRDSATLGGTSDTSNVQDGTNAAGSSSMTPDTAQNGSHMRGDSTSDNGNVDPSGHVGKDSINSNRNSRASHQ